MAGAVRHWYVRGMMTEDISSKAVPAAMKAGPSTPGQHATPANPAIPSAAPLRGVNPTDPDEPIWMTAARVAASP